MTHHGWRRSRSRLGIHLPVTCLTILIAFSAIACVGAAAAKNVVLGKSNKSNSTTTLKSQSKKKVALAVANTGGAAAASFSVKKNKTPFTVNSSARVKNLNADLLDGVDSTQLQRRVGGTCAAGSAIRVINPDGSVSCQSLLVSTPPNLPAWSLTGNAGTNPSSNFLGTTDAQALVVRTNNTERLRVTADGLVGVGTASPTGLVQAAANAAGQTALVGSSANGNGIFGSSAGGIGVFGDSPTRGVVGTLNGGSCPGSYAVGGCGGTTSEGVLGDSSARGVIGTLGGTSCAGSYGVGGCGATIGDGVLGNSTNGNGVNASGGTNGVLANGGNDGVSANGASNGVFGSSSTGIGVRGDSTARGVVGTLNGGSCPGSYGVGGCGGDATGVQAISNNDGVLATSHHASGGNTAAAVRAINDGGGDIFIGQNTSTNHVARIDSSGKGFFDGGTQTGGADYAESIPAVGAARLHPGDVLAIDARNGYAVGRSSRPNSRLVVGVYSTRPAVLAVGSRKATASGLGGQVPVAMMGVVPTKVTAAGGGIRPGDLLTSSSVPGFAMRAKPVRVHGIAIYPQGTIIGKALQSLASGRGVIEVMLLSR